jgi:hypothetical protein
MSATTTKTTLIKAGFVATLLLASSVALADVKVTLTASPTTTTLPDGQSVPMWGLMCGTVTYTTVGTTVSAAFNYAAGTDSTNSAATPCTRLAGGAQNGTWQPPLITVPSGQALTITLVNNLSFPAGSLTPVTTVPTSLVIVGQLGGGLGGTPARMQSPVHAPQGTTWPGTAGGTNAIAGDAVFIAPAQADRVRSFGTEVAAGGSGTDLTWSNLRPGTYLIESGTQPSIQGPMGLYGVLVVAEPDVVATAAHVAYGTTFDTAVPLLLSEIDPTQNAEVAQVVQNAGFSDATVWNGKAGACGDVTVPATAHTCYPPAVNYSPLYYLVNGVSFDATTPALSALVVPAAGAQKNVLLRLVNAGLRMHVPSVVGASMSLIAEDGNKLPGVPKVQNEVFLAAGKTFDVAIAPKQVVPATTPVTYLPATYAVFDRALGLSTNNQLDGGMQVYLQVAGGLLPGTGTSLSAGDKTYSCVAGVTLAITDPAKGLLAGAVGANGAVLGTASLPLGATLDFQANGTFTYTPPAAPAACAGSFSYLVNGVLAKTATIVACTGSCLGAAPTAGNGAFTSNIASRLQVPSPGVLAFVANPSGLSLTATGAIVPGSAASTCGSVTLSADGSFTATPTTTPTGIATATCTFTYNVSTSTKQTSTADGVITVTFNGANNLAFTVKDAKNGLAINDYRWIVEEDRTFWIDPMCQINRTGPRVDSRGNACPALPVESLGYNFHTANMPVVAQGCVGTVSCEAGQTLGGAPAVCDIGDGKCRVDAAQKVSVLPSAVHLDPSKRYFISVLPGDGVNATIGGAGGPDANGKPFDIMTSCGPYTGTGAWEPGGASAMCGHAMGGSQIAPGQAAVNISLQQTPLPTAKIAVFVFEDDNPLNGENDAGGGVDIIAPNEPGLGGFEIKLFDQAGGLGDATGQITYDMFNQPVSNSLAGKIDPITGLDSCPINARGNGPVGMVPTCPRHESDNKTPSPLAGQAVIANLYPGLYEIVATPAADRIARGEEWLQTNTLDGGKPHEAFIKPNEPGYFQEFGPGGFHVSIGFANPAIINARKAAYCGSAANSGGLCNATLNVQVTNNHMSRTPDQRTFSSETYDHYSFTNCYVSVGPADGEDFAFQKCNPDGTASFTGMPTGVYKITVFDQWNDIMLDGLVGTVTIDGDMVTKVFPVTQWRTNLFTRTFIDQNGDGVSQETEPGLALVNTNIHYRDGSIGFFNNTDLNGYAGFNEVFPFMNWLVVETSSTRYKPTGVHTVYDAGGPVDCSAQATAAGMPCSNIAANIANTAVRVPLPADLRVPGARYCDDADCTTTTNAGKSTGTVFPPQPFGTTQGWQGLLGQNSFMEFGVKPFVPGETGGISGMVIYASTRPFDDPALSLQLSWEPGVPRVKVNLYQKTVDDNGNEHLKLVDTTTSASWDDWAQGFRPNGKPNMNCPGQDGSSPFFQTLKDSKQWLDPSKTPLPYNSQFKCYDGWSQLNQIQPAPYDGLYKFPSVLTVTTAGKPATTNCTGCVTNPDDGNPMLPAGKYVVEVVLPPGYELVKEEDKNILLGDVYIAPVTQQFAGFGNIFIMPDQAAVNAYYNPSNPGGLNLTTNLGANPRHEGDTGSVEAFWPCVGAERIVPDLNSLFPGAGQAAPFAGAKRRLCDRKEVTLQEQASALTKFFIFSSTHIAGHFTGTITNDFASEFDPFSPQFGEKFGPPNLPVGLRDFTGNEVARVYSDQWGIYNGLYFSSYSVNPPNPTGYVPQMSIACMNDPGPIVDTRLKIYDAATGTPVPNPTLGQTITDPSYNSAYSNFCYETPFMPGFTAYMDTPVIPTQAFADQYNLPDTEYPDRTPAIKSVVSTAAAGPWVRPGSPGSSATILITISSVDQAAAGALPTIGSIAMGGTSITGTTPVTCPVSGTGNCGGTSATTRANNMAALVVNRIGSSGSGYSATRTNATVTITAPAGSFATLNGTTFSATAISHLNLSPVSSALAGGAAPVTAQMNLTVTALGDKVVQNPNYAGPNANTAPYNQKTITRHYGFGACTPTGATSGPCSVTITNPSGTPVALGGVTWSDASITAFVPNGVCPAPVAAAGCEGQLVITAANGKQSIDAITVTVGGKAPWVVTPNDVATNTGGTVAAPSGKSVKDYTANFGRMFYSPIQTAIDSADPGDLILVQPGTYRENLLMWKPVRLQGVGAASVTINADAHPAGKMDSWRRQVNCTFGLTLDGTPNLNNTGFAGADPNNSGYSCPADMHQRVDRIPFEAIVGWDASGNGNLAQVLQEPTLMGAYEGAGITVLGRGVRIPSTSNDFWGRNATGGAGAFTNGSVYLTRSAADCAASNTRVDGRDYGTSNFFCNPSSIDGVSVINSSQGGGGVFIHGWAHNLEVGNTRISGNHGTLAGAINLGNGETPDAFINNGVECGAGLTGANAVMPCPPVTWRNGGATGGAVRYSPVDNAAIAFQFNTNVRIHHNMLYNNASVGDALFSGTPSGAGAVTVSAGADGYQIDHNWIAGNLSTGDGGGLQHLGLSFQGKISNNYVLFNQSTNPTLPTSGGGIVIEGANLDRQLNGTECGSTTDQDCPPGLGQGTGFGLVVDANLIMGNSAESGTGGGLRIQQVNGSEFAAFQGTPAQWYDVTVTNNVIASNVAGWDGGGVSMQDAMKVSFVNNTVVSNDTTASAGVLFKTLGAIMSNTPPPGCTPTTDPSLPQNPNCLGVDAPHGPQPAGLVVQAHTPNMVAALGPNTVCPAGYGYSATINGDCRQLSKPALANDMFFQNRAFRVDITTQGTGLQSQQNLVALKPALNQTATGQCPPGANFWDVGLRTDDFNAGTIPLGTTLAVTSSILTGDPQKVIVSSPTNILGGSSPVIAQACNGARTPPESCNQLANGLGQSCNGYNAPPGASETTGIAQLFLFNGIKPTATVDEGHNWLNLTFGPLTLNRSAVQPTSTNPPELMVASAATGTAGGAYSINGTSAAVNRGNNTVAPTTDFFGNTRPKTSSNPADIGAVEYPIASGSTLVVVNPAPLSFSNVVVGSGTTTRDLVVSNNGTTAFTFSGVVVTAPFSRVGIGSFTGLPPNCPVAPFSTTSALAAGASCTIRVQWTAATSVTTATGTATVTGSASVSNSPVTINANTVAATYLASANASALAFGSWATGTTSAAMTLTVANTGNSALSNLTYTFGGGTPQPYSRPTGTPGGTCGATLAAGATCTVNVLFVPAAVAPFSLTLTVANAAAPAAQRITAIVVSLTGTGVANRATVSITPSPMTIALNSVITDPLDPNDYSKTGLVTLTNTAAAGGSQVSVTGVSVTSTGGPGAFTNGPLAGPDNCTGAALTPGGSCTVSVRYTVSTTATRGGANGAGTITFTDTATGSSQVGQLAGVLTP